MNYSTVAILFLAPGGSKKNNHLFTPVDKSHTYIAFKNTVAENAPVYVFNYIYFCNGWGVAIDGFNNDSLPDVFTGNMVGNKLYLIKAILHLKAPQKKAARIKRRLV